VAVSDIGLRSLSTDLGGEIFGTGMTLACRHRSGT